MPSLIRAETLPPNRNGTRLFEGGAHGTPVSLFLISYESGRHVPLHRHPYAETWVVQSGLAEFRVGADRIAAGPGDILVVEPGQPHGFSNRGEARLEMVCIHANGAVIQEWAESEGAAATADFSSKG